MQTPSSASSTGAAVGPWAALAAGDPATVAKLLDEAPTSAFHRKAVLVSGVGFFTDAYDLFVISTVATLVGAQWHLGTAATSWVAGSAILGAFAGALVFGRLADLLGRRRVYAVVAAIMIVGAVGSAVAPNLAWLVVARIVLGLGVGGDYPVSAVLMSEYSNRSDRGKLVGLVFSMQAVGLIVGPLVAIVLLGSGLSHDLTWRLLLALGAVPAAAALHLRTTMARVAALPGERAAVRGAATAGGAAGGRAAGRAAGGRVSRGRIRAFGTASRQAGLAGRPRSLPRRSPHAPPGGGHRGSVVPLRLRLLR